jgi:hypothetical protein
MRIQWETMRLHILLQFLVIHNPSKMQAPQFIKFFLQYRSLFPFVVESVEKRQDLLFKQFEIVSHSPEVECFVWTQKPHS